MKSLCKLIALLAIIVPAATVHASAFDMFGYGSRGAALGNAMTGLTNDFTSIHYNLAAMTETRKQFGIGYFYTYHDVYVRLKDRPSGIDPRYYDQHFFPRRNTSDIDGAQGLAIGFIHDLWSKKFRFGLAVLIPTKFLQVQKPHFNDEREQFLSNQLHFELLGNRVNRQVLTLGLAYQLHKKISLGLGMSMLQDSRTDSYNYSPDPTDINAIYINIDVEQETIFTPHLGVLLKPWKYVSVGLAYRGQIDFPIIGKNYVQTAPLPPFIPEPITGAQELNVRIQYTPEQFCLGFGFFPRKEIAIGVDAVWARWSQYVDNHDEKVKPRFEDTLSPRLGIEWQCRKWLTIRGGYAFEPTPISKTKGRYNFVDNDRHIYSTGFCMTTTLETVEVEFGWHLQYHHLKKRTVMKSDNAKFPIVDEEPSVPGLQTGNPGYPGFTSGGYILNSGISVSINNLFK